MHVSTNYELLFGSSYKRIVLYYYMGCLFWPPASTEIPIQALMATRPLFPYKKQSTRDATVCNIEEDHGLPGVVVLCKKLVWARGLTTEKQYLKPLRHP